MPETLFIGVGNSFRRDDGAGPVVAARLSGRGAQTRVHAGDGTGLIEYFSEAAKIVLIDATRSGAPGGTILDIDATRTPLPTEFFHYSTHRFGLAEAVETARRLGLLPEALRVIGIEGVDFGPGEGLSEPVEAAVRRVVSLLGAEISRT